MAAPGLYAYEAPMPDDTIIAVRTITVDARRRARAGARTRQGPCLTFSLALRGRMAAPASAPHAFG